MAFIQTAQQWHFDSELALEEVVWRNLPSLLNVEPLQRQFSVEGKVCDLLAVDSVGQLMIIELKNTEDRYIAQQLTRYYDALRHADKLPFTADTSHPRLVATRLGKLRVEKESLPIVALSMCAGEPLPQSDAVLLGASL